MGVGVVVIELGELSVEEVEKSVLVELGLFCKK